MSDLQTRQIYVALVERGNDQWRRVDARSEGVDTYRILSENALPEERWEYLTGELVRCRSSTLPTGERVLVATQRVRESEA